MSQTIYSFYIFPPLGLHIAPLWWQPNNETSRSFLEKGCLYVLQLLMKKTHVFCPLLFSGHTHIHTHTTCKNTLQLFHFSFSLFVAWEGPASWSAIDLTPHSQLACKSTLQQRGALIACTLCNKDVNPSSPHPAPSPRSSLCVYTSPFPLQLCRSDGWCINGTCVD